MRVIDIREAKRRLSQLVDEAARGESFVIAKDGEPLVEVSAFAATPSGRVERLGFMAGHFQTPDDFDRMGAPEIERLFGSRSRN
ncbi:type II toxin-antitoxin system prevent-host-death family antitoxin [Methylosinus sp. LW3]|uniref:type II toxin-antitoxin system Phd/YefM family antitoxin n=1 Tax=Methylosinus sp. LW3 TaxID=107635 RepID=UPI00046368B6|nr:type II toxin-antitoxin system prevent-host-death family antitoxin [Methylosinus sp. LW3]